MHLSSLVLRGFKSFASATTLRLEPGITCVVGPNGSGKSNVVDALAWVMGEQGAKTLRGGSMQDVVFAGSVGRDGRPGRPPLGRAEVTLTIDNADGALPVPWAEVTISRTMFRSGGSEYAINGAPARLLDVQELLSDAGIGREMHVIVGQGRLDAVLHATPEDRRALVEEAAGILKHRRRKERTLRKLDAMSADLARLADLSAELRRRLAAYAFPNLFYLPASDWPPFGEGFVRFDHMQAIRTSHLRNRRHAAVTDEAMAVLNEWLAYYLTGRLEPGSPLAAYREEQLSRL